jgi:hypothetical protein
MREIAGFFFPYKTSLIPQIGIRSAVKDLSMGVGNVPMCNSPRREGQRGGKVFKALQLLMVMSRTLISEIPLYSRAEL